MKFTARLYTPFSLRSFVGFLSYFSDSLRRMLSAIHGIELTSASAFHSFRNFIPELLRPAILYSRVILSQLGLSDALSALGRVPRSPISASIHDRQRLLVGSDSVVPYSLDRRLLDNQLPWFRYILERLLIHDPILIPGLK